MCPFVSGMPRNKLDIPPFFRRLRRAMSSLLLLRFVWFHSTPVGAINWRTFLSINSGRNSKFCVIMTVEFNTQPRLRPKSITPRTSSGNVSLIMFWTYSTCSTVSLRRNEVPMDVRAVMLQCLSVVILPVVLSPPPPPLEFYSLVLWGSVEIWALYCYRN